MSRVTGEQRHLSNTQHHGYDFSVIVAMDTLVWSMVIQRFRGAHLKTYSMVCSTLPQVVIVLFFFDWSWCTVNFIIFTLLLHYPLLPNMEVICPYLIPFSGSTAAVLSMTHDRALFSFQVVSLI